MVQIWSIEFKVKASSIFNFASLSSIKSQLKAKFINCFVSFLLDKETDVVFHG